PVEARLRLLADLRSDQRLHRDPPRDPHPAADRTDRRPLLLRDLDVGRAQPPPRGGARRADAGALRRRTKRDADRPRAARVPGAVVRRRAGTILPEALLL